MTWMIKACLLKQWCEADDSHDVLRQDFLNPAMNQAWHDMILTENEALRNRVADLEKKVQEQADEIVCLRSTLADLIRRVTMLEGGRTGPAQSVNQSVVNNNILPSKFSSLKSSSVKKTSNHIASESIQPNSGPVRTTSSTLSSPKRISRGSSPGPIKKWSSSSDFQSSPVHNATYSSKDIIFNQDDGYLRMYLCGHPITMYVPTENLRDYQYNKPLAPPPNKLHLEWVYGYRGRDCRSNLYLLPTGEIVYFIAAVIVLYNVEEQMQRHYTGHTDDVKCLAVHPNKFIIASGQLTGISLDKKENRKRMSVNPADLSPLSEEAERLLQIRKPKRNFYSKEAHIRVWDSVSLNTMHIIGVGDFERSVSCLAFSKTDGGAYLCAVDESSEHVVSLWDWQKGDRGQKITEMKSGGEAILAVDFHPIDKTLFVTCGKSHINFWRIEGTTITKKLGTFEKYDKPKYLVCLAFSDSGDILTGDSNGNIFVWGKEGNTITKAIKNAHEGGVFSLCILKDGSLISGGGKDRRIIAYDGQTYSKLGKESELPELAGPVRTLMQGKGNMILVGTTKNCILQGTLEFTFNVIIQGHTEELWGAAVHPSHHQFLTCGGDRQIHLWSSMTHDTLWSKEISESAVSACFHPEGSIVVIGTTIGRWIALDIHTREVVSVHTDGNERLSCMAYSPDSRFLAVGSHDNCIYVYQVSDDGRKYNRINRCQGHSSYITHIDWSKDSQYLMTNSGDYEILYWNAAVCRQVNSPSNLKDLEWNTHTCTLGFSVCGVWPENADGTDINSCAKSHNNKLVATGDDFGQVKLFSYPCNVPKSLSHIYRVHSSHVTRVYFLFDDTRLITLGGNDNSIMQWIITAY